ncbi:MazG-like family protein [Alkaliphilus sp. MSJ-5]|uniref:MazG-like family protein n=1 Tax=Alkaliphilus flagellatus TaxID=2841507 RepID=A0ABS6G1I6_9FIRM|nr:MULTISPECIES: MazG-like family protein [Alkaliphilus]MBU5676347.1 MazG-like family protein [Alkaliphilus flagellatus]QUH19290.1 MazG-like family protein [Alkaliphilus sp. B6464]
MFDFQKNNVDIGRNIKMIDFLKCELLSSVSVVFEALFKGAKEGQQMILEGLANIILVTYSLGKRLGIDYDTIDKKVQEKARLHILEEHHLEKWYGDLSSLHQHLKEHGK